MFLDRENGFLLKTFAEMHRQSPVRSLSTFHHHQSVRFDSHQNTNSNHLANEMYIAIHHPAWYSYLQRHSTAFHLDFLPAILASYSAKSILKRHPSPAMDLNSLDFLKVYK